MRENDMQLKPNIEDDGTISALYLSKYSGGDEYRMRLQRLQDKNAYWVVERFMTDDERTYFIIAAIEGRHLFDVDDTARFVLKLAGTEAGLAKRDAEMREYIEKNLGTRLPVRVDRTRYLHEANLSDAAHGAAAPFIGHSRA